MILAVPAVFFSIATLGVKRNVGPVCDQLEGVISPGRAGYAHHCQCVGIKVSESPPSIEAATRCIGWVARRWTEPDEIVLKELKQREEQAKNPRRFEILSPAVQEKIKKTYKELSQASYRKDYALVIEKSKVILSLTDHYSDTKAMEAVAQKALGRAQE